MKKLLIFDYDKTLAPPKSEISTEIQKELVRLLENNLVAVITGGMTLEQLIKLLVERLTLYEEDVVQLLIP